MAKRKMSRKALNLPDHKLRLAGAGAQGSPANAWVVAGAALILGLLLMYFLK